MAENPADLLQNLTNSFNLNSIIPENLSKGMETLIFLSKIGAVLIIIYFVVLIIEKLFSMRNSSNIKSIAIDVKQINEKLDLLTTHKKKVKHKE